MNENYGPILSKTVKRILVWALIVLAVVGVFYFISRLREASNERFKKEWTAWEEQKAKYADENIVRTQSIIKMFYEVGPGGTVCEFLPDNKNNSNITKCYFEDSKANDYSFSCNQDFLCGYTPVGLLK